MPDIYFTFRKKNGEDIDLKVSDSITVLDLILIVSEALELPIEATTQLQAEPLGCVLEGSRTLAEEGVGTGALLTLL